MLHKKDAASLAAYNLLQIKAIKLSPQNPFTWASGMISPIYCDNRISLSFPGVRDQISNTLLEFIRALPQSNAIAGVATAGIPHGAIAAFRLGLPFIYVRSEAKKHGRQNKVEGEIPPGSKIILVEDLISTGGSSLQAATTLLEEGHQVLAVCSIFTYNLAIAKENFTRAGIPLFTVTTFQVLIEIARQQGIVSEEDYHLLIKWQNDPENWQDS